MNKLKFSVLMSLVGIIMLASNSANAFVLGPTTPGKWGPGPMGTGATVTWGYMADGVVCNSECGGSSSYSALSSFMPAGFGVAVTAAFAAWSTIADITFTEVTDGGEVFTAPGPADIRLGGHLFDGPGGTPAHGYFPPDNGSGAEGDIHFDIEETWKLGFGGAGFDIFTILAHEIGHAIGLGHTAVPSSLMNTFYTEAFFGLQADDIAGAVFLYGAPVGGPGPNPVDEPYTLILMLSGLALLLRRKSGKLRA